MFCEDILDEGECIWTECIGVLPEDLDVGIRRGRWTQMRGGITLMIVR